MEKTGPHRFRSNHRKERVADVLTHYVIVCRPAATLFCLSAGALTHYSNSLSPRNVKCANLPCVIEEDDASQVRYPYLLECQERA
ncbi:hypothetical protein BHE74_00004211 [Ensete ventricosum]|nr:hypothetical protein GW17_00044297 [Ensete ventricosum]RWW86989.1 hypothetical protein BHE74_00004211 [Ensete ventricosum]